MARRDNQVGKGKPDPAFHAGSGLISLFGFAPGRACCPQWRPVRAAPFKVWGGLRGEGSRRVRDSSINLPHRAGPACVFRGPSDTSALRVATRFITVAYLILSARIIEMQCVFAHSGAGIFAESGQTPSPPTAAIPNVLQLYQTRVGGSALRESPFHLRRRNTTQED